MTLNIKNQDVVKLAKELSVLEHQSMTQVIQTALQDRLFRIRATRRKQTLTDDIMEVSRRCSALADKDTRTAEAIIGFDANGLP